MPSNCIFCNSYKQYHSSAEFIMNRHRAPYKTYKSYKVYPLFYSFLITAFLTLYIGEKKGMVLTTFNGPSTAYKPNYSYRCFRYCFRCCFSLYFLPLYTARTNPAVTTSINPAATTSINSAATARIDSAATARINSAATACINLAVTCCSPPYYRPVGYWAYYYSPPYRGAARLWFYYGPPYYGAARS